MYSNTYTWCHPVLYCSLWFVPRLIYCSIVKQIPLILLLCLIPPFILIHIVTRARG